MYDIIIKNSQLGGLICGIEIAKKKGKVLIIDNYKNIDRYAIIFDNDFQWFKFLTPNLDLDWIESRFSGFKLVNKLISNKGHIVSYNKLIKDFLKKASDVGIKIINESEFCNNNLNENIDTKITIETSIKNIYQVGNNNINLFHTIYIEVDFLNKNPWVLEIKNNKNSQVWIVPLLQNKGIIFIKITKKLSSEEINKVIYKYTKTYNIKKVIKEDFPLFDNAPVKDNKVLFITTKLLENPVNFDITKQMILGKKLGEIIGEILVWDLPITHLKQYNNYFYQYSQFLNRF